MPSSGKSKFSENEKLLCYHGPLIYEAKCVKVKKESGGSQYYVHYQGWNKNWDEWVPESRMLKMNPESRVKQKELLAAHLAATKESKKSAKSSKSSSSSSASSSNPKKSSSSSRASTPVSDKSNNGPGGGDTPTPTPSTPSAPGTLHSGTHSGGPPPSKKRKEEGGGGGGGGGGGSGGGVGGQTENSRITKFKISIPEELRYVLVNDWDLIVNKNNLFNLPAKLTVNNIIEDYLQFLQSSPESKSKIGGVNVISEILKGIRELFNNLIGVQFLYNAERKQYDSLQMNESQEYADVYGSPHLLRLLSKIDSILNLTRIEVDPDVALIESIIGEFLKYLEDNMEKLFTSKNYKDVSILLEEKPSESTTSSASSSSSNATPIISSKETATPPTNANH